MGELGPALGQSSGERPTPCIAFVVHAMQVAGAEVLVAETVRRLGSEIVPLILCLDSVGQLGESLIGDGVEVIALGRRPGLDLSVARRMAKHLRDHQVDVIHAHQYTPFFYAALAKLQVRNKPRLILTEHGRHFPDLVSHRRRLVNRWILGRLAEEITACSEFSRRALAKTDGFEASRIQVIPNGIQLNRYSDRRETRDTRRLLGLDPDKKLLVCVARFHPVKDHTTLLRAFAEVTERYEDVDLLLVGDGPLRESAEALCAELSITDRTRFLGIRSDVADILHASDIFTMTSLSEAASLTVLEAMASALPLVLTAVGGNPELVRHEVEGLLVPRQQPAAAAGAILRLLEDDHLRATMGEAGRQRVTKEYQLDRTIEAYRSLYTPLSGKGRPQIQHPEGKAKEQVSKNA